MINQYDLINKFFEALNDEYGYIYGKTHEMWTQAKQEAYNKAKANDPDCQTSIKYGNKWYGHWVTDCSGLFAWAFSCLGGSIFHGSNTIWNNECSAKGELVKGKRDDGRELLPGTAVFVYNKDKKKRTHIGLYVDDGLVIEAAGTRQGVITTKITNSKWSEWGELKGVNYNGGDVPVPEGYAIVTGKRVALRQEPSKKANVIMRIDTGKEVKLEDPPPSEWDYVSYQGRKGYMMKEFLKEG
jgi:uncharacterized protein YgiM (DUF1202 family)